MIERSDEERWHSREKELLEEIEERIKFYVFWCERNRIGQRVSSLVVLVCSVLAPISVVSGSELGISEFGIGEKILIN
ncbi:MAG: hypothetical protein GKS00_10370 [Alphaproteobacteria bacterium]|nr:hypothetical protein [Alphaproteobacteria bacterium]